jgi:hypothetical protein
LVPTAFDPASIATGDFNHDGIPDLVYTDSGNGTTYQGTLHVLLGKGDGTYTDIQDISLQTGFCGCTINVADVTGGGKLDLVIGSNDTPTATITTLVGNGDGTFAPPVVSTFTPQGGGAYPMIGSKMGIADINGDGAADLVVPDGQNGQLYILKGNKTGSFQYVGSIQNGSGPTEAFLTDLNGDGNPDLVVFGVLGGNVTVYLGKGNAAFSAGTTYNLGPGPTNMLLTDLDGDGHPDIVSSVYQSQSGSQFNNQILFLHGNADGSFAAPTQIVSSMQGTLIDAADYNGDGIPDLVVLNQVGIGIFVGQGNLTYKPVVSYIAGPTTVRDVAAGSFIAGGHRDVAMGVEGGILELIGNGDGTFSSVPFYDLGYPVGAAVIADFNGDGNPDIAATVPAEYPRVLLGKGDGTFQPAADQNTTYGSGRGALTIAAGNFSGNGDESLVAPSSGGTVPTGTPEVLWGNGNGSFTAPVEEDSASTAIADFNGDGRADMVSLSGSNIAVLLGQAGGTFKPAQTPLRNPAIGATVFPPTAVGDLNRDGKPDLVISSVDGLEIWLGNGDGTFTYKGNLTTLADGATAGGSFGSAAIADLDGDGNPDLVLFSGSSVAASLSVLYGNGDGTFQAPVLYPISHYYQSLVVADINGDGKPDLILYDAAGISAMRNLGSRTFAPEEHYVAGGSIGTLSVADVNRDGYPDIVVANDEGTTVAVLLNEPATLPPGGLVPSGALAFSPEPSADLQPFQITLTLAAPVAGGATPTGSVSFAIDGVLAGNESLNAGVALFISPSALSPGYHIVTAAYHGDQNYGVASYRAQHTVNAPVYTTTTALTVTPTSVFTSQTVHMQATVAAAGQLPIGYVTFLDGSQTLAAVRLNSSGIAYFDTALLQLGTHAIVASYGGFMLTNSDLPEVFTSSTSAPITVSVNDNPTTTTLSASSSTVTAGTVFTLTATVASAAGAPFGDVTFFDGATQLGTFSLLNGKATFSTASLSSGVHSFTAAYNANATFGGSTSQAQSITIQAAAAYLIPTCTSVSETPDPAGAGIALTAQVSSASANPRGVVTFLIDGTVLGAAAVSQAGTATLASPTIPADGQHLFRASFAGNSLFAPSVSPALAQSWQNATTGFALGLETQSVSVSPSVPATIVAVISAPSGSTTNIALACGAGLPQGYVCSFAPASLAGPGTSILTIHSAQPAASESRVELTWKAGLSVTLSVLLFLPVLKRRRVGLLIFLLVLIPVTAASGCGAHLTGPGASAPQVTVLVVQASQGSGASAQVQSAQITMIVNP